MERRQIVLKANGRVFSTYASNIEGTPDKVIFLLHGFPDDNTSFDRIWPIIEEAFPRSLLLAPTMRGYEPSSQGNDDFGYSIKDIASDVVQWIQWVRTEYEENVPVHLIGHDWGAFAAFQTASLAPHLIESIMTLAIPYLANISFFTEIPLKCPMQLYYSSYLITMQIPWLYNYKLAATETGSYPYIEKLWKFWSPDWRIPPEQIEHVYSTFRKPGVIQAATAYYRCLFRSIWANRGKATWSVDFNQVPCLQVGGATDGCMHQKLFDIERTKLVGQSNVKIIVVPNVGHFMQREDPVTIGRILVDWLQCH